MKPVKSFNETINHSYNITQRHAEWAEYREKVTAFISSTNLDNKDVLIVGAGNLNDINLNQFRKVSKSISLLDVDTKAVTTGLKRQKLDPAEYTLLELDLTGLDQEYEIDSKNVKSANSFFDAFTDALNHGTLKSFVEDYENHQLSYNLPKYDVIVILPIYTQILLHQLMNQAHQTLGRVDQQTAQMIMELSGGLLSKINNELLGCLAKQGIIVALSDVLEYSQDSAEYTKLSTIIADRVQATAFYETYLDRYGYSLGAYGLYDLASKCEVELEQFMLWNFDINRRMLVKCIKGMVM